MDILASTLLESAYRLRSIIQTIGQSYPLSGFAVNIGAGDGISLDLVHPLFVQDGFSGVAIEGDSETFKSLSRNLPEKVKKINSFVSPYSILSMLNDAEVPHSPDLIDIDIDGFDYFVAQKILKLEPKVVSIELHEDIPPGIKFTCLYDPNYRYGYDVPWGCSIDMVASLATKMGYSIVMMDWNSLFLVHNKYRHLFNLPSNTMEAYRTGYYDRPQRKEVFYWKKRNFDLVERPVQTVYLDLMHEWQNVLDCIILEPTVDKL